MKELEDREQRDARRSIEARKAEHRQKRLDTALGALADLENGRIVLWSLIDEICGALNGSFAGENTHTTAFAEGKRAVGLEVISWLQRVAPSDYVLMLSEALNRRREEDAADVQEPSDGGSNR